MLSKWPIRDKLLVGLSLLLVIVGTLSWGELQGLYKFRGLVGRLHGRVNSELPLANEFSQRVGDLRGVPSSLHWDGSDDESSIDAARADFREKLAALSDTFLRYRGQLNDNAPHAQTMRDIEQELAAIDRAQKTGDWTTEKAPRDDLNAKLEDLQGLAGKLPLHLQEVILQLTEEARSEYRALIVLTWITSITTAIMLALFVKLMYQWIFLPLKVLIQGSRKVAAGEFSYRIRLASNDEISELAAAMNDMTARFQAIRDDLDRQVQLRTKQVVRSEQLASVGFLAAGVAHEINNPLASIALCAESLEGRMNDIVPADDDQAAVVKHYLRMIQDEAFRCKEITERLLDFSRIGDVKRQTTDLRELVQGVIEMLGHLGKYQEKHVELVAGEPLLVPVNPQEIKQVVLNLLTNGLDSLDPGGTVRIELDRRAGQAEMVVSDNGCGMTPDVLEQIFEPFFTRRRGGQGTGLGLSIVYRIVADHEGSIEVHSDGPARGSTFRVRLPLALGARKENENRYQAA
ncbi:MAG: HAMP domain-containing histidine kinase [Planctomycetia bacterium]|nr:HAMP domain-containing histidine kinase [Planctomycetia bacterium]